MVIVHRVADQTTRCCAQCSADQGALSISGYSAANQGSANSAQSSPSECVTVTAHGISEISISGRIIAWRGAPIKAEGKEKQADDVNQSAHGIHPYFSNTLM